MLWHVSYTLSILLCVNRRRNQNAFWTLSEVSRRDAGTAAVGAPARLLEYPVATISVYYLLLEQSTQNNTKKHARAPCYVMPRAGADRGSTYVGDV